MGEAREGGDDVVTSRFSRQSCADSVVSVLVVLWYWYGTSTGTAPVSILRYLSTTY
jgi:hypothetical protein